MKIEKGDYVQTPRFLGVRIEEVFTSMKEARKNGYTEPTHYDYNPEYGIFGKSLDMYHMVFAAFKKN